MKIGILTLPFHTNYGGILQGWALSIVLENMGHEVFFIKQKNKTKLLRAILRLILRRDSIKDFLIRINRCKSYNQYKKPFSDFVDNNFKFIDKSNISQMDVLLVGSDQIWRRHYYNPLYDAFGAFAAKCNQIKRIAYAASFGVDFWEFTDKETRKISSLIAEFDAISVREKSGVKLSEEKLFRLPELVLDPTLLLLNTNYNRLAKEVAPRKSGSLFVFILDNTEDKVKALNTINLKLNHEIVRLDNWETGSFCKGKMAGGIPNWLSCFRDADFIFTDSYHGTLFSILYNKPFVVYGNKSRGLSRFSTIMEEFKLQDRFITNSSNLQLSVLDNPINWIAINEKMRKLRDLSVDFLKNNILNI